MTLERIKLNRLIKIMYSDDSLRRARLREDIGSEKKSKAESESSGGDFYLPFWADAKAFVKGEINLHEQTKIRISASKYRQKLYPRLLSGFYNWWTKHREWSDKKYQYIDESVAGNLEVIELASLVKIDNFLPLRLDDGTHRIIYPYLAEKPQLPDEGARIILYNLNKCFKQFSMSEFEVLDVLRSKSFNSKTMPASGDESKIFVNRYLKLIEERDNLTK